MDSYKQSLCLLGSSLLLRSADIVWKSDYKLSFGIAFVLEKVNTSSQLKFWLKHWGDGCKFKEEARGGKACADKHIAWIVL